MNGPKPIMEAWQRLQDELAEVLRHARREVLNARQAAAALELPESVHVEATAPRVLAPAESRADIILRAAEREWRRGVREPVGIVANGAPIIDGYIRGAGGLGWNTCDIVNWKPGVPYTRNGMFAWCGAFAATCYAEAGLKAEIRRKVMSGTPRLYRWAKGTARFIAKAENLLRGDLVIVGSAGDLDGAHITIFDSPLSVTDGGVVLSFSTWEGNAKGVGPDGERYEGVVKQTRPVMVVGNESIYRFAFGVRPLEDDYERGAA